MSEAHRRVGSFLRQLDERGATMGEATAAEWAGLGLPDGAALLDPEASLATRAGAGGPSPASVLAQADAVERGLPA